MKLVYSLSSPLVNGSGWVYQRFTRLLSTRALGVRANLRRGLSSFPREIRDGGRRRSVSGGLRSQAQLAGCCPQVSSLYAQSRDRFGVPARQRQPASHLMSDVAGASVRVSAMMVDDLLQELMRNPPKDLSPVRQRQREKAMAMLQDEALLDMAHRFDIVPLAGEIEGNCLRVGSESLPIPERLPKKGVVTAFACGAYTLGPRLEARVRALFSQKRAALALALDALGNELLLALGRRMRRDLLASVRSQGLILGQRLQVGESEFDLPAQAAVLRLAGAGEIGIDLHRVNLLKPQKSNVAVFAVGRKLPKLSLARYRE